MFSFTAALVKATLTMGRLACCRAVTVGYILKIPIGEDFSRAKQSRHVPRKHRHLRKLFNSRTFSS